MASAAHRSIATIRASQHIHPGSTPNTPPRNHPPSTYSSSPSTIRADDDFLIIEAGSRFLRVGFAGDNQPKVALTFGPSRERRAGDFSDWQQTAASKARLHEDRDAWADEHEIWHAGARGTELGLIYDRLDRLLRDAFMRCLLIDSRPRRVGLVLDAAVPIPLLSTMLDLLFKGFQAPMISLLSGATMTAVAAGLRSALVVDMGWRETVVTSVYEYREVKCTRTVRGGRFLHQKLYELLRRILREGNKDVNENGEEEEEEDKEDKAGGKVVGFAECEDVMHRLMWCRPRASAKSSSQRQSAQLDTVVEQDESDTASSSRPKPPKPTTTVPLRSTSPPRTIEVRFDDVADVCDDTFFDKAVAPGTFDDHEVPVHLLVYQHLVQLPIDVRAVCMPRLVFTGGCSNILGVRERIVDELADMVERWGWANVSGKEMRNSHLFDRRSTTMISTSPSASDQPSEEQDINMNININANSNSTKNAILGRQNAAPQADADPIEAKVARHRPRPPLVQGFFRSVQSLGPWAGASLLCQLKVPAMATIDRELWLQQGPAGASRPSEVDVKAQQRQSLGTVIRGSGGHHTNWTLGTWGYL